MERRLEVLDLQGIAEQFVFASGVGTIGLVATSISSPDALQDLWDFDLGADGLGFELTTDVVRAVGGEFLKAHNEWCIKAAKTSPRLRPVPFLDGNDLSATLSEAERLVAAGLRAIGLPSGVAPGGKSPGHRDVDPLWEFLAASDVPLLLHAGGDFGFLGSTVWRDYGTIKNRPSQKVKNPELLLDPYSYSQIHLGPQNFLTAMIFGGVFDRFPDLRLGCIEVSAYWVGPMAENIKNVGDQFASVTAQLSLTPAEYLERNVRVTPYFWEPVDKYIDRFGLEDVYVYGSDYPHFEGGVDPANTYATALERLGPTVAEKFFVTNAELLMPAGPT
jgi:predicted TIM-barrel fold metal-dependent hydrolase